MTLSSTPSSCHWPSLPVEIQLAITQLLDVETLLSLSLVSHHNHALCLPAIYNVRWLLFEVPLPLIMLICRFPVGNNIVPLQAPTLRRSRAGRPCAAHSLARHQHRRHRGGEFRRTDSNPFPRPPSSNALSSPFHRVVPASDIVLLQARAADRSRHRALPRCDPFLTVSCPRASSRSTSLFSHESGASGPS
jgi:hypothetical protein